MSHQGESINKNEFKEGWVSTELSGRWKTIGVNNKRRLGIWKSKEFDNNLLFEFNKKGSIKVYIDKDDDWNLNRKKDVLIGNASKVRNWEEKMGFSKDFFHSRRKGKLTFKALYQGSFLNNADGYEYFLDFHNQDSSASRLVNLRKDDYGLAHLWYHNNDKDAAYYEFH